MSVRQVYGGLIASLREDGLSLNIIGRVVGVTRERVRQILMDYYPESLHPRDKLGTPTVSRLTGIGENRLRRWAASAGLRRGGSALHSHYIWTEEEMARALQELRHQVCVICGREAPSPRKAYCSDSCAKIGSYRIYLRSSWRKLHKKVEERWCIICGHPFQTSPFTHQKCCSLKCGAIAGWRKRRRGVLSC